ncbi:hypothetical protein BGAL_0222g00160 [Botrytis galanthina]|uniref:NmrA-like domain-containing protein n=1 Tax=Botrytis galanthina TaxID=278940 RepID=A0A4V4HUC8_9HELO|nr:hypothetical protein BGAL_0222g00160 [Botrytis galanthina]
MASTSVLLFGATGYIGAAFLSRFSNKYLMSPSPRYKLTASTRSPEKARRLRDLLGNIETTDVTLNDGVKLEREVEKHDIIIQLIHSADSAKADCDALEGTKSILKGMKTRKEKTGYPPILYHAIGPLVLQSNCSGGEIQDRVVDHRIVKADEAGDLLSFIIVPFAVYGTATGLIHEHKLGNQTSMPVPRLIHVSVDRRAVGQIGPGENPWMISHVDDVADLFMALLEDTTKGHGEDGFYFADGGYVLAHDVFRAMAETLYSIGLSEEPSPNTYTEEELNKYKNQIGFWGASIQATGDRAKSTGWNPQHTVGEFQGYVVTETKRLAFQPLQSYGRCLDYSDENTYTSSRQQLY